MKAHALKVMNLPIDIIRHDNEESVVICFKLVIDLYQAPKALLELTVAQKNPGVYRSVIHRTELFRGYDPN